MRDATEGARKLIEPYSERIEELEEENRRLRECISDAEENARILMGENEALWELLDYMTPIAWYAASEREHDRMRELGIEVES